MLSYQHVYHAGNFADVHKHWLLSLIFNALNKKQSPWCYFESHAGRGGYDLHSTEAVKTAEWHRGIQRLYSTEDIPQCIRSYLQCVTNYNSSRTSSDEGSDGKLGYYPGSPRVARHFAREQDRIVLCELHPQECSALKKEFKRESQVHIHQRDGYEGIAALTPAKEKRGLILFDPSYEVKQDYIDVPGKVAKLTAKWRNVCVAIWYPLLSSDRHVSLINAIVGSGLKKVMRSEISLPDATGLRGSGMLVINPPWRLDEQVVEGWSRLCEILGADPTHSVAAELWSAE